MFLPLAVTALEGLVTQQLEEFAVVMTLEFVLDGMVTLYVSMHASQCSVS